MMNSRGRFNAGLCGLLLAGSGCAAIHGRIDEGAGHPYIGTCGDAYSIGHPGQSGDPLVPIFCVFDLPFSFIVDTLCLPYDVTKESKEKKFDPHGGTDAAGTAE